MSEPKVEEVYKRSGIPTHTFVEPKEYGYLRVAIRTPGRGVVIEGPSGIGKTTAVISIIDELGLADRAQKLSARVKDDVDLIEMIPGTAQVGLVIIDDFHRLPDRSKHAIADYMKDLADREDGSTKIVLIGIIKAGDSLVHFAPDLNNRIDTIRFEANSQEKIGELIGKGEFALNIKIDAADKIAQDSGGSFHIAQILCSELCISSNITERCDEVTEISTSLESVKERVLGELARTFSERAVKFARGKRFRRVGRAPYLLLLKWLSESEHGAISIDQVLMTHPESRGSVSQIAEKDWLENFVNEESDLQDLIHYDTYTKQLAIEDPKFIYYIKNLLWSRFVREAGFTTIDFDSKYDFALSFAGEERPFVEKVRDLLKDQEIEVFYDRDEQHRILAEDVEEYLAPIYRSEAKYVVAFLSKNYPKKIWTKFESQQFQERFGSKSVIPIWFSDAPPGIFDESTRFGGLSIDVDEDWDVQAERIAAVLVSKIEDDRNRQSIETRQAQEAEPEGAGEAQLDMSNFYAVSTRDM